MKRLVLVMAFVLAASAACHRVRIIRSGGATVGGGGPPPSAVYFNGWYSNVILGLVDISGPVDLNRVCGGAPWTEIYIVRTFLNSIVWAFLGPIWSPQAVTVYCGGGPGRPGGYALEGVVDRGKFYRAP